MAASDTFLDKVVDHQVWSVHPPQHLVSQCTLWTEVASSNLSEAWCDSL